MALQGVIQSSTKVRILEGRLRHRVQIVKPVAAQDTTGGWSTNQNTVVIATWASVEALTSTEKFAAHEFASEVTHKIFIRHPRSRIDPSGNTSGITADMQVWFGTRQFQIEAVLNPDEIKEMLILICCELDDSKNQAVTPSEASQ